MTIRLEIKIIVARSSDLSNSDSEKRPPEFVAYAEERNTYDPECLNEIVPNALTSAAKSLGLEDVRALRGYHPEISVSLFSDQGQCRPSMHLGAKTLALLSEAGVEFDFDPYTYDQQ